VPDWLSVYNYEGSTPTTTDWEADVWECFVTGATKSKGDIYYVCRVSFKIINTLAHLFIYLLWDSWFYLAVLALETVLFTIADSYTPLSLIFFYLNFIFYNINILKLLTISFIYLLVFFLSIIVFTDVLINDNLNFHVSNKLVLKQLVLGVILFIVSETFLFVAFFWAFFYISLSPNIFIGGVWLPVNIVALNPWHIPFLNTVILLTSGLVGNWFFYSLKLMSYESSSTFFREFYNSKHLTFIKIIIFNFYYTFYANSYSFLLSSYVLFNRIKPAYLLLKTVTGYSFFISLGSLTCRTLNTSFTFNFTLLKHLLFSFLDFFKFCNFYYFNLTISFFANFEKKVLFNIFFANAMTDLSLSTLLTISLGYMFLGFQINEYIWYSSFSLSTAFGSVFYLLTALHGLHVYVGILSFSFSYILLTSSNFFYRYRTFYFKYLNIYSIFSIWYWHFVDVVWVFLFLVVYIWSN